MKNILFTSIMLIYSTNLLFSQTKPILVDMNREWFYTHLSIDGSMVCYASTKDSIRVFFKDSSIINGKKYFNLYSENFNGHMCNTCSTLLLQLREENKTIYAHISDTDVVYLDYNIINDSVFQRLSITTCGLTHIIYPGNYIQKKKTACKVDSTIIGKKKYKSITYNNTTIFEKFGNNDGIYPAGSFCTTCVGGLYELYAVSENGIKNYVSTFPTEIIEKEITNRSKIYVTNNEILTIEPIELQCKSNINIYNSNGKIVTSKHISSGEKLEIYVKDYVPSVYIVSLESKTGNFLLGKFLRQ